MTLILEKIHGTTLFHTFSTHDINITHKCHQDKSHKCVYKAKRDKWLATPLLGTISNKGILTNTKRIGFHLLSISYRQHLSKQGAFLL